MTTAIETSQIEFDDDRVVKRQSANACRREIESTRIAASIARRCGLFLVPNVIDADSENGVIVFERLKTADTLRRVLPGLECPQGVVTRAAEILAHVHNTTVDGYAFVHGDFTIENVLYAELEDQLAIIDWSAPRWLLSTGEIRPLHDVAMFLMSLFNRPVFYPRRIRDVDGIARIFLARYAELRDLDTQQLAQTSKTLLAQYLPYYRRKAFGRFVANYPSIRRFRRFVMNL